jgi:uncharacterized protein (DUF1800 family)
LYWKRVTKLETERIGYWWANRKLATKQPLQEKMTLFWHGHFATGDEKVQDYRKMLKQNEVLRARATGNFRDLLISVSQDPAMLAYLDAGVNLKGAPNENSAHQGCSALSRPPKYQNPVVRLCKAQRRFGEADRR